MNDMPRPQFTLRALLVAMLVVAAFFGGMAWQKQLDKPKIVSPAPLAPSRIIMIELPDGSRWFKYD